MSTNLPARRDQVRAIAQAVRLSPRQRRRRPRWWQKLWRRFRQGDLRRQLLLATPLSAVGFAIWAFGGVYDWAYGIAYLLVYAGLAAWAVAWWRGKTPGQWQPVYAALLIFGGWVMLQYLAGITVVASSTLTALFHLGAAGALFFLVTQTYQGETDAPVLAAVFAVFAAALALLAIAQILTEANGIFWHFTYAYGSPAGTYVNRNNFAGCMEMLIPLACVAAYQRRQRSWLYFLPWAAAPALAIAAVVLAASRGGVVAVAVEAVAALAIEIYLRRRRHPRLAAVTAATAASPGWLPLPPAALPTPPPLPHSAGVGHARWSLIAGVALTLVLVTAVGTGRLQLRFLNSSDQGPTQAQRQFLNQSSWQMFRERPWFGWGLGTWADVYPAFARFTDPNVFEFAHDDYLQMLTETGLVGAAIVTFFWWVWIGEFRRRLRAWPPGLGAGPQAPLAVAAAVGCLGLLVHSAVDFNLHIPANLLLFFALCGLALPVRRSLDDLLP